MKNRLLFLLFIIIGSKTYSQNALFVPDTLSGTNFVLTMHEDSVAFFPGKYSHTYAFNNNKYLGPTLFFQQGTNVNIVVHNQISDTTTVHWHGIHVPAIWDGGPYSEILPGDSWNPQFTVMDHAAMYWYHPHPDMKTAEQAIKGAAGLIIVRDPIEAALALPRTYGVDDIPLVVQSQQYDSLNQAMPRGMQDSTILVNGTMDPFVNVPAQIVRLRLLNASGERTFNFGFTANMQFYQIGSDGGLLDVPYATDRVRLGPGERAEVLVDLNNKAGQTFYLMSYASELAMGIQGGPTMPMPPGYPNMDSPLNGIDFNILQFNVGAPNGQPILTIPNVLTANTPLDPASANITRTIRFTADSAMVMDGPFYFNDSTFNMERIDYQIPLNNIEMWKLVNETMVAHPFHIHDVQFYLLDRNGVTPTDGERGRKDVVLIPPGDSVTFITQFTDFADSLMPYMYHCHILMHEDDGMMGQFVVMPTSVGVNEISSQNTNVKAYPNPAKDNISIAIPTSIQNYQLSVKNIVGQTIYSVNANQEKQEINTSSWPRGMYFVEVLNNDFRQSEKIVLQ
jgi:bilirubin oxidase